LFISFRQYYKFLLL